MRTASACTRRCAAAPVSARSSNACAATSPARPLPMNGSRRNRAGQVVLQLKSAYPRRHHPRRHVAAGIHAAPGRPGAASAPASDPLPRGAGTPCEAACSGSCPSKSSGARRPSRHCLRHRRRMTWARLLKRVFDIDIEHCPNCGGHDRLAPRRLAACLETQVSSRPAANSDRTASL